MKKLALNSAYCLQETHIKHKGRLKIKVWKRYIGSFALVGGPYPFPSCPVAYLAIHLPGQPMRLAWRDAPWMKTVLHLSSLFVSPPSLVTQLVKNLPTLKKKKRKICPQCRRPGFDPWIGKIPWRREKLPTPVFWPGEFCGPYSPWGRKELDTPENFHFHFPASPTTLPPGLAAHTGGMVCFGGGRGYRPAQRPAGR